MIQSRHLMGKILQYLLYQYANKVGGLSEMQDVVRSEKRTLIFEAKDKPLASAEGRDRTYGPPIRRYRAYGEEGHVVIEEVA